MSRNISNDLIFLSENQRHRRFDNFFRILKLIEKWIWEDIFFHHHCSHHHANRHSGEFSNNFGSSFVGQFLKGSISGFLDSNMRWQPFLRTLADPSRKSSQESVVVRNCATCHDKRTRSIEWEEMLSNESPTFQVMVSVGYFCFAFSISSEKGSIPKIVLDTDTSSCVRSPVPHQKSKIFFAHNASTRET